MDSITLPNTPGGILEAKRAAGDLGHTIWKGKMIFLICPEIPLSIRKLNIYDILTFFILFQNNDLTGLEEFGHFIFYLVQNNCAYLIILAV